MLVLSRRQNERISFPNLGIKVDVLRVAGKIVKLGIDAPEHVRIMRDEVSAGQETEISQASFPETESQHRRHFLSNRLNTAMLGLQVLQSKLNTGRNEDLDSLIDTIFGELKELNVSLNTNLGKAQALRPTGRTTPRALVVEDNANEAQLLAEFLRVNGYETEVVANGMEAITFLQRYDPPDVVLLDMHMPELDGPQTIRSIRAEPRMRGLKLFGVSGLSPDEMNVPIGPLGVDCWFSKPVDARRLIAEIDRELHGGPVAS